MKAYRPYKDCPIQDRPLGVLPEFPWQVEEADETSVERGFTVISEEDFNVLIANLSMPNYLSTTKAFIESKIQQLRDKAPALLKDLYSSNTMAGINTEQSNQMFDDYADIITRLTEGAWPSAIVRLQEKTPSGFVTQQLIDNWIIKIQGAL